VVWKMVNIHLRVQRPLKLLLVEVDKSVLLVQDFVESLVEFMVAFALEKINSRFSSWGEPMSIDRFDRVALDHAGEALSRSGHVVDASLHDLVHSQMHGLPPLW